MRKRLLILLLFVPMLLRGQEYPEFFSLPDSITNEYLDTVQIPSHKRPNNNWLVGGFGGVTLLSGYFNPVWATELAMHAPTWGFSVIKNATMMNMFPNVGLEVGFQYTWEGYRFKRSKETGNLRYVYGTYAYDAAIRVPEVFMLTNGHFDIGDHFKLLVKAGMYGGYRESIYRKAYWEHPEIDYTPTDAMASNFESIRTTFLDNENRYTAGLSFGAGFGIMLDPIEIHFNALVNWGFITFYDPDFLGEGIYYRYAYPLDGAVTVGLYYQLTPRVGRTRGELRRLAREMAEKNNSKR